MEALRVWGPLRRSKAWGPVLVAAAVGCAVFWEVRSGLRDRANRLADPRYLIASRDLKAQLPLSPSDLGFRFAEGDPVPSGAITDQELHLLGDSVLNRELRRGDWLTWSALTPRESQGLGGSIPRGMRAQTIDVDSGPPVFPRDRIDVLWRPREGNPQILLEGITVLGVRRDHNRQSLVISLAEDDIPVLEKARSQGTLAISVRNPEDRGARHKRRGRGSVHRPLLKHVEIWTERK